MEMPGENGLDVRAPEGRLAREELVCGARERVDVRGGTDVRVVACLLRRHVRRSSAGDPHVRVGAARTSRQAEVDEDCPFRLVLDDDVRRLHVTMDDTTRVSCAEPTTDVA